MSQGIGIIDDGGKDREELRIQENHPNETGKSRDAREISWMICFV